MVRSPTSDADDDDWDDAVGIDFEASSFHFIIQGCFERGEKAEEIREFSWCIFLLGIRTIDWHDTQA